MGGFSKIEWTTHTFNPWWGCTKVSDGCKFCYAEGLPADWGRGYPNVWLGTSVEDSRVLARIGHLAAVPSLVRFLSVEPLIGPIEHLPLAGINWVIVGGESGPKARPMKKDWVQSIHRQCREAHVPFFFKQWGGPNKKKTGRHLDGEVYDEMPAERVLQPPFGRERRELVVVNAGY
jgi:protein gp37